MSSISIQLAARRIAGVLDRGVKVVARHVWIWPFLGMLITVVTGMWVRDSVEHAIKNQLADQLQTVLNAEVTALRIWFREKESDAKSLLADSQIQAAIDKLIELARQAANGPDELLRSPALRELQGRLKPMLAPQDYTDFVVVGKRDQMVLASLDERWVGKKAPPVYEEVLRKAFRGQVTVTPPFLSEVPLADAQGNIREGVPTMLVAAPMKTARGAVTAILALRLRPEKEFNQLFLVASMGESGETYAFDRSGVMLTSGRFGPELRVLGLLSEAERSDAMLNMRLVDPGIDLRTAKFPLPARGGNTLTRMAAEATRGQSGFDTRAYRNYRGVPVVGAWTWLPDYRIGVATEVAAEEAYEPLYILRRAFLAMFLLLLLAGLLILAFTITVGHLQTAARKSTLMAKRLGQYELLHEIGAGGNGRVFKARHAMMRRPVAIKLVDPERTDAAALARFEREVQITSQLTHPNTVAIYDYGKTPDGVFYYAMEMLDGLNLDKLVSQFGPQPEGRVIHILRQVCGSLAEAHSLGLIHRDIKPANILLTRRGGVCDVSKVLDFGVVKAIGGIQELELTAADSILGTPNYLSPEAIETPEAIDARSDLYAVGAVGYFLLTARPLHGIEKLDTLLKAQVKLMPRRPSELLGQPVTPDLENIIMQCLAKDRNKRPSSAARLAELLAGCSAAGQWTAQDAEAWWRRNRPFKESTIAEEAAERPLAIIPR